MSAKILIIGDSPSSKLLAFALDREFEIVFCKDERERAKKEEDLRISERGLTIEKAPPNYREFNFEPYELKIKQSPTKQQRREWRQNRKQFR